jgi:hypothetical protein
MLLIVEKSTDVALHGGAICAGKKQKRKKEALASCVTESVTVRCRSSFLLECKEKKKGRLNPDIRSYFKALG